MVFVRDFVADISMEFRGHGRDLIGNIACIHTYIHTSYIMHRFVRLERGRRRHVIKKPARFWIFFQPSAIQTIPFLSLSLSSLSPFRLTTYGKSSRLRFSQTETRAIRLIQDHQRCLISRDVWLCVRTRMKILIRIETMATVA